MHALQRIGSIGLVTAIALAGCGQQQDTQLLQSLQEDLRTSNSTIDSLNLTVDTSNQLIDALRARADSLQGVDERLLASVQELNREVREWRQLALDQRNRNDLLKAEVERLSRDRQADQGAILRLRAQSDSLTGELLAAHAALERQNDYVRRLETELGQGRTEVQILRQAAASVRVRVGTEAELQAAGYLQVTRPSARSTRKTYRMVARVTEGDPAARLVPVGGQLALDHQPRMVLDRYGRLKEGTGFRLENDDQKPIVLSLIDQRLAGTDLLVVTPD